MLSPDTVLSCEHIKLKVSSTSYSLNRLPSPETIKYQKDLLRFTTKYDYKFKECHKDIYTIYTNTSAPYNFTLHYYHKLPMERTNQSLVKYITSVSPNILPLYTNFSIPIDANLQEPTIVSQYQ